MDRASVAAVSGSEQLQVIVTIRGLHVFGIGDIGVSCVEDIVHNLLDEVAQLCEVGGAEVVSVDVIQDSANIAEPACKVVVRIHCSTSVKPFRAGRGSNPPIRGGWS